MDIKFANVSFKYKGTRNEVLSHTTLAFTENRIYGLLGKNGVGKSTMLYLAAGLLEPTEGTVRIAGEESKRRRPEILKEIFFVPEEFSLPNVRLSEYVSMNAPFYPNFSREMLDICLKDFGMSADVNLGELSMGQKKKVFMSFALATGTRILLMDEPTNGLDIPSKSQFRKAMSRMMDENRIVIISTHQVHDVEQLIDHVVIMSKDGVLMDKSMEEIAEEYVFEYRLMGDTADAIYCEPSLQGTIVMAPRGDRGETQVNLELLFNAIVSKSKE